MFTAKVCFDNMGLLLTIDKHS